MTGTRLDLGTYARVFSEYRSCIDESTSMHAAATYAEEFLTHVGSMFQDDIVRPFQEEIGHLWSSFPDRMRTPERYKTLTGILLGQAVDFYWYAGYAQYANDGDAMRDPALLSFGRRHADFHVKFTYVQYYRHILMRIPNSLRLRYRRIVNHPGRYTQGLTLTRCKRAMAALINQLSEDVAYEIGLHGRFKLMVNSVLRTVAYQSSLARMGYVAPRYSAHLAGYAVDVEKLWYQAHAAEVHEALARVLGELFEREVINVIVEDTHWHICLNPDYIPFYESLSRKWERNAR